MWETKGACERVGVVVTLLRVAVVTLSSSGSSISLQKPVSTLWYFVLIIHFVILHLIIKPYSVH